MQQKITIKVLPSEAASENSVKQVIAQNCAVKPERVTGYTILKKSLDARSRQAWFHLTLNVFIDEPFKQTTLPPLLLHDVSQAEHTVVVVGAGPAGLFAAIHLIELGVKPILLERGKDVRARRRDLAAMNKEGVVNPESNYCFGEGGAGTYSDGKLYTRSTKRGDVQRILNILVHFGADERILYEAHPHIGTNKLPHIITAMREKIIECGGEVRFDKKLTDFTVEKGHITSVTTADGDSIPAKAVLLATGHSARDIFELLHNKKLQIEFKPFALGVRVEHPQHIIDTAQYHCDIRSEHLPPAAYSLVQQVDGKGVFSFCMCPGGIIAPAATAAGEVVVNGWSPSKRNNPYANSGIVVNIEEKDIQSFKKHGPLAGMLYQQAVEHKAFNVGGGKLVAPAQRMEDFFKNKVSSDLPDCSYLPGIHAADLRKVLPTHVHKALQTGFKEFGKKMKGYFTNEAVVVATESRTSSPIRIPRHKETLQHPQVTNLYPCAEGAGYAGGIVSAAMDGEKVAEAIATYSLSLL
ncbi:NAD(P)/FAD-dependent oxidoreductase [Flavisolibacter tropicus]|uniref:FAD-binding protein n=1 Tax=Flavisolibacter tropicus TaxID=1492898 RepID=A0A172TTV0_9BACT|nr:FAD-dependent monooxygenase [Flavisolibacter tropicus]ANE50460.1 FAD-binding protein [Flavisolibacter tropicus]